MPEKKSWLILATIFVFYLTVNSQDIKTAYAEQHRPQIHFSPKKGWMNDPNGMVFLNGKYHIFFQYNPDSTVWGPMHWGHATSTDLIHWRELPIALYPDSLGTIFSGSAVIDKNNTSGFGPNAMVAIYTNHSHELEKAGSDKHQTQSIAYSTDEGKSWTKYNGNPVIQNPGIKDFRDPKVSWHEPTKKWIMTLATLDHITFYSSPDLKSWTKESEFGKTIGAHGGVWECPDLFPLTHQGKQIWVLIVNLNPGGPNGGSATQYFTGDFDGHIFTPFEANETKWLDYGPDEYAGITWSNTGEKKLFIGWMSNWKYAQVVPTNPWRSAMTTARELAIEKNGDKYMVRSFPVKQLNATNTKNYTAKNIAVKKLDLTTKAGKLHGPALVKLNSDGLESFSLILSNKAGEKTVIGYDKSADQYFVDRSRSGKINFDKDFGNKIVAPRLTKNKNIEITLVIDNASVEFFGDNGLSVITAIFFPSANYTDINIVADDSIVLKSVSLQHLEAIWK